MPDRSPKTDWISWSLHAVVGGVLGGICGGAVAYGKRRSTPLLFSTVEAGIPFVVGAALVGAAFGTYLGERWWSGPSPLRVHPEGFEISRAGKIAALLLGLIGAALMIFAILHDKHVL